MKDKTKSSVKWWMWLLGIVFLAAVTIGTTAYNLGVHKTQVAADIKAVNIKIDQHAGHNKEYFISIKNTQEIQSRDIKILLREVATIKGILSSYDDPTAFPPSPVVSIDMHSNSSELKQK